MEQQSQTSSISVSHPRITSLVPLTFLKIIQTMSVCTMQIIIIKTSFVIHVQWAYIDLLSLYEPWPRTLYKNSFDRLSEMK